MSTIFRAALLSLVCVAGSVGHAASPALGQVSADDAIVRRGAMVVAHESRHAVLHWLRRQPEVGSAALGRDGQTLDLFFRDGQHSEILPNTVSEAAVPVTVFHVHAQLRSPDAPGLGRALVAEPFAAELGLGAHAGEVEADDLRYAGFSVDQVSDAAVNVDFMKQLTQYSFVYMLTHSGVNQYGEGVIATGQLANAADDAAFQPLMKEYAVLKVGVSGTDNLYYGILSNYIKWYMGAFTPHAVLFLNGCTLLKASLIWQALQAKGVGALLSWDEKGATQDDVTVAGYAMGELTQGKSVADAVNATFQAGYGVSNANGVVAKFGYLGDGSLTLRDLLPEPTATTVPTATATPTPSPIPTRTISAPSLTMASSVRPGARQTIRFAGAPRVRVRFEVQYPNGDRRTAARVTDGSGMATYSYVQPPSMLVHSGYSARASVMDVSSQKVLATGSYRILFGALDVSVIPRRTVIGGRVDIWVHTSPARQVVIQLRLPSGRSDLLHGYTGPHGWTHPHWRVPKSAGHGTATVTARSGGGQTYTARTTFTIR